MRALLAILLLAAAFAFVPTADAHQCASGRQTADCVCPVPDDGQYHQHAYGGQTCQGGPGIQQEAGSGGASQSIPGFAVGALLPALAAVALLLRRS